MKALFVATKETMLHFSRIPGPALVMSWISPPAFCTQTVLRAHNMGTPPGVLPNKQHTFSLTYHIHL